MSMNYLHQEKGIIANPDIFLEDYIPPDIPAREPHIRELQLALSPALERKKPVHSWLFGRPGAGKSVTARYMLRQIEKEGVEGLYINCFEYRTFFSVMDKIIRELRLLGAEKLDTSYKLERFARYVGKKPFILILDEIDRVMKKERETAIYNLSTIGNVGLILACNSELVYFGLDERVKSRLNPIRIEFRPYSIGDLSYIIRQRAEYAVCPYAWGENVLEKIAELSEGDARIAMRTLKSACELAEKEGRGKILSRHIKEGWGKAKELKKDYMLNKLTYHHRILHDLIKKRDGILSGELWISYLEECKNKGLKPVAQRTFCKYIRNLKDFGLIQDERALVRGKVSKFRVL